MGVKESKIEISQYNEGRSHSQLSIDIITAISQGDVVLDVCNLTERAYKLIDKHSASRTTVAFGELVGYNTKTALKIFLDNIDGEGVLYESNLYKYIIDKIIVNNYSPNFIPYLGFGKCKLDSMHEVFKSQRDYQLLDRQLSQFSDGEIVNPNTNINILITEVPKGNIRTLFDIINQKTEDEELEAIFVQLLYSLSIMSKFRITHNDMHPNNIIVSTLDEPVNMCFIIGVRKFFIRTRLIPYLFDWDNSYCEMLGKNPYVNEERCKLFGMCNSFSDKRDMFMVACSMFKHGLSSRIRSLLYHAYSGVVFNITVDKADNVNEQISVGITEEQMNDIERHVPFFTDYNDIHHYRMSSYQLEKIIGKESMSNSIASLTFSISQGDEGYSMNFENFRPCYPRSYDSDYPTALEILLFKGPWTKKPKVNDLFSKYLVDEIPPDTAVYTMPTKQEIQPAINYDPYIESSRHLIEGKPAVPIKKKSPVYVSTIF